MLSLFDISPFFFRFSFHSFFRFDAAAYAIIFFFRFYCLAI